MQKNNLNDITWPIHMFSVINEPVEIKGNKKKVLVLIPSKDRNDLLFQCINSIITHTSKRLTGITVCIIDTGSTEANLKEIDEYMNANKGLHVNIILKQHGYYNFAKNNNQAFSECNGQRSFDYVVFCNNDIKFLNDVLSHMLWTHENFDNVGTVGARLHFGDGKIQHIGAFCKMHNDNAAPGHYGFNKPATGAILTGSQMVSANTCALLMMDTKLFNSLKFNTIYEECFEDVELNIEVLKLGKINYCNLSATAFHYESQTRNDNIEKDKKQYEDLKKLSIFIKNNKDNKYIKAHCYD